MKRNVKMGKKKTGGLADKIETATNMTVKSYANLRNLSLASLRRGYITRKTAHILNQDGIYVEITKKQKEESPHE